MALWNKCLKLLEQELSDQQLNTWIRPLQVIEDADTLRLLAPNRFVLDWVNDNFLQQIRHITDQLSAENPISLSIEIGSQNRKASVNMNKSSTIGKVQKVASTNENSFAQLFLGEFPESGRDFDVPTGDVELHSKLSFP